MKYNIYPIYHGKIVMNSGEHKTVREVQIQPNILFKGFTLEKKKYYTLVMRDPDALLGHRIHWLIQNIPLSLNEEILLSSIKENEMNVILPYSGPSPPPHTGKHHYIFELYEQKSIKSLTYWTERYISYDNFIKKMKLKKDPISSFMFIAEYQKF